MAFKKKSFWVNDDETVMYPTSIPQAPPTSTVERVLIPASQARKKATNTMYRNIVTEIDKAISEGETYCIYKTGSDVPEWIRKALSELGYEVVLTMKQKVIIKW